MVGRNEVAKLAGVAPSTVSNVINNKSFVSEDIRKKVLWAINELGYEPNYVAKSLRSRRTKQIIVFISDLHNTYYADLCEGIIGTLTQQGYTVAIAVINDPSIDYYKEYYSRQVDGIINLSHIFCEEELFQKFLNHNVAMVNCRPYDEIGSVSIDYLNAVSKFVEHLMARGRKRIGFINGGTMESVAGDSRYYGLKAYLEEKGIHFDVSLLINGNNKYANTVECGYRASDSGYVERRRIILTEKTSYIRKQIILSVREAQSLAAVETYVEVRRPFEITGTHINRIERYLKAFVAYLPDIAHGLRKASISDDLGIEQQVVCRFAIEIEGQVYAAVENRQIQSQIGLHRGLPREIRIVQCRHVHAFFRHGIVKRIIIREGYHAI